jgi:hypothetical protein
MNTEQLDIIVSSIGVAAICLIWRFVWVPFTIQRLRQDLFDVRDQLFDMVARREVPQTFESQIYKRVRNDLNHMIRYSDHLGFIRTILVGIITVDAQKHFIESTDFERRNLEHSDLELIRRIDRMQEIAIKRFLILSSPTLWLILCVVSLVGCAYSIYVLIRRRVLTCRYFYRTWVFRNFLDNVEYQSGQMLLSGRA